MKLQYNVQRFSLKHLQKIESNKSLSAKNDKEQQLQLRQAEKDYYELFEALAERDRANTVTPSPFAALLLQQTQAQYGTVPAGDLSGKIGKHVCAYVFHLCHEEFFLSKLLCCEVSSAYCVMCS